MNDSLSTNEAGSQQPEFLNKVNLNDKDWLERTFGWWFRLTMPPRPEKGASFVKREADRRARLLSTIGLFYLAFFSPCPPSSIFHNPDRTLLKLFFYLHGDLCLSSHKLGKVKIGSSLLVLVFESGLVLSILSAGQLGLTDIPLYDIFIMGELIAVSLLPIQGVFIVLS